MSSFVLPGSSLDPYTRLLASIADLVSRLRQSLLQSLWGCTALALVVVSFVSGCFLLLTFTSILWLPVLLFTAASQLLVLTSKVLFRIGDRGILNLARKTSAAVSGFFSAAEETLFEQTIAMERHQYTDVMRDPGFLRAIFDTMPGVDSESALARMEALSKWRHSHEDLSVLEGANAPDRQREGVGDLEFSLSNSTKSSIKKLSSLGLFEQIPEHDHDIDEQACWQAGRPSEWQGHQGVQEITE
mmetsp:Transcript_44651/g.140891  ORF Transcript_44651/g.140891 Transcript_44651/m.140891 type:complete len:244 (-) Transcript_44651:120-851(-)